MECGLGMALEHGARARDWDVREYAQTGRQMTQSAMHRWHACTERVTREVGGAVQRDWLGCARGGHGGMRARQWDSFAYAQTGGARSRLMPTGARVLSGRTALRHAAVQVGAMRVVQCKGGACARTRDDGVCPHRWGYKSGRGTLAKCETGWVHAATSSCCKAGGTQTDATGMGQRMVGRLGDGLGCSGVHANRWCD